MNEIIESFFCSFEWYDGVIEKFVSSSIWYDWEQWDFCFFLSLICCWLVIFSVVLCIRTFGSNGLYGCTVSDMKGKSDKFAFSLHCYEKDTSYIWLLFALKCYGLMTNSMFLERIWLLLTKIAFVLFNNVMGKKIFFCSLP